MIISNIKLMYYGTKSPIYRNKYFVIRRTGDVYITELENMRFIYMWKH